MSTKILPVGELILTNEHDLIGAGYDYLLRGPTSNPVNNTGSFSLTGNADDRKLRFDHCFIIDPSSPAWIPTDEESTGFFHFRLEAENGTVISEVSLDFIGDKKYTFENRVHYTSGHSGVYNIPAPKSKMSDGTYRLIVTVNPEVVICAPAVFHLGIENEDSWMSAPPEHPIMLLPFVEGSVTWKDLNPTAPHA